MLDCFAGSTALEPRLDTTILSPYGSARRTSRPVNIVTRSRQMPDSLQKLQGPPRTSLTRVSWCFGPTEADHDFGKTDDPQDRRARY